MTLRRRAGTKQITKVWIDFPVDESPDFSDLGEFSDKPEAWAIVREGPYRGQFVADLPEDAELPEPGRESRFFVPYAGGEPQGTEDYRTNGLQDWERMESYNNDQWSYHGVIAKASFISRNGLEHTVSSGGVWGVGSDSGDDFFAELAQEEMAGLKDELLDLGFSEQEIDAAFANVESER
jgi:hypothetical protein